MIANHAADSLTTRRERQGWASLHGERGTHVIAKKQYDTCVGIGILIHVGRPAVQGDDQ